MPSGILCLSSLSLSLCLTRGGKGGENPGREPVNECALATNTLATNKGCQQMLSGILYLSSLSSLCPARGGKGASHSPTF